MTSSLEHSCRGAARATPAIPRTAVLLAVLVATAAAGQAAPSGYLISPSDFSGPYGEAGVPIGWAGDQPATLLYRTQALQADFTAPAGAEAVRLGLRALNGDHLEAPEIEVLVNGVSLGRGKGWSRITYQPGETWPWAYAWVPADLLRETSTVRVVNHGPDWWVCTGLSVDFPTRAELEAEVARVPVREAALRPHTWRGELQVDGELREPAWQEAARVEVAAAEGGPQVHARVACAADALHLAFEVEDPTYPREDPEAHWRMGRMWDLVEVVLALGPDSAFQFWAHPDGRSFARRLVGEEMDLRYTPLWEAAASAGIGRWQAELRVPFAALGPPESEHQFVPEVNAWLPTGQDWRINLLYRRQRHETGMEVWAWHGFGPQRTRSLGGKMLDLPLAEFRRPHNLGMLQGVRGDFRERSWSPLAAVDLGEGQWGRNRASLSLRSSAAHLAAHLRLTSPQTSCAMARVERQEGGGFTYFLPSPGVWRAELYLTDDEGHLTYFQEQSLRARPPLQGRWHRSYYTGEAEAIFRVSPLPEWSRECALEAELRLEGPGGWGEPRRFTVNPDGRGEVGTSLSGVPEGSYRGCLVLRTPTNDEFRLQVPDLVKLPPAPLEVKFRDDGFMLVKGQLRLPFATTENLTDAQTGFKGGFNSLMLWNVYAEPERAQWYERAAGRGPLALDVVFPYEALCGTQVDYPALRKLVRRLSGYEACLGYYLMDEPEYLHDEKMHPEELLRVHRFVKALDPYRPTVISQGISDPMYNSARDPGYFDVSDVVVVQAYGEPVYVHRKLSWAAEVMQGHPAVMWAYLGVIQQGRTTPELLRAQVYTALANGARGLVLFAGPDLMRLPELFPEFTTRLAEEIEQLAPILAGEEPWPVHSATPDVVVSGHRADGKVYVIAVNLRSFPVTGRLVLPLEGAGQAREVFGERRPWSRQVSRGLSLTMPLEAWGVRVYEVTAPRQDSSPPR